MIVRTVEPEQAGAGWDWDESLAGKVLPHKYGGCSLDPQSPCKKPGLFQFQS